MRNILLIILYAFKIVSNYSRRKEEILDSFTKSCFLSIYTKTTFRSSRNTARNKIYLVNIVFGIISTF